MSRRLAAVLYLLAAGCAVDVQAPTAPVGEQRLRPASVTDFSAADWAAAPAEAPVIARVGGVPITASQLETALALSSGADPEVVLERLVEVEILAQTAMRRGLHEDEAVGRAWREALAQRLLARVFEPSVRPEDLPLERVQQIYWVPRVRKLYDHADAWRMGHLFFSCCDPKIERCDQPEVVACFEDAGRAIQDVYAQAHRELAPFEGDPDALMAAMRDFREEVEQRWPQLAFRERPFYYDPSLPHDQQKGYTIIAEAVARTAIDAPLAVLQEPVQSPFGWHVIAKLGHDPEERRGPDDPGVIADIRDNAFPELRKAKFRDFLAALRQQHGVQIHPEMLDIEGRRAAAAAP